MNRYPKALKDAVVKKLIELEKADHIPTGTYTEIAQEAGIATNTVYQWNAALKRKQRLATRGYQSGADAWVGVAKFQAVVATTAMSELELGEYLRKNGILKEDLASWRATCEAANDNAAATSNQYRSELATERAKSKDLERELRRKEKALAETAALLVLRKRAHAIWGDNEEE